MWLNVATNDIDDIVILFNTSIRKVTNVRRRN